MSSCETVREVISARLDGEDGGLPGTQVDAHLAGCAACRAYADQVTDATRRARLWPAGPGAPADVTARVAVAVATPTNAFGLPGGPWPLERLLLLVLGVAQLVLSVPPLLGSDLAAGLHVSREIGVTDVAFAVGLLAAAWQPWRAAGMLPVVLALGFGLAAVALVDVLAGRVSAVGEAPHLLAPVSALLLVRLRRRLPRPPGGLQAAAPGLRAVGDDERRTA